MSGPISFLAASGVVAVVGAPLALNLVPPNRMYGFRTARTLADRALWFRVNRFAGVALVAAAVASGSVYILVPALASGRSLGGLVVFVVPLVAALGATMAYARKAADAG